MTERAKKDCVNCHWGLQPGGASRCFEGVNCFANREHPNWTPETNGDRVRKMTDRELADLWGETADMDPAFIPECGDDVVRCKWANFLCESCPETFFNWLQAEAEDDCNQN